MNRYIVTIVDTSDTCDGKARVLKSCVTYAEAKDFVRHDMETYLTTNSDLDIITDWNKMSAWTEDGTFGCEWNIEEIDVIPIDIKKWKATENVLVDNGIDADEASTVLQAVGYTLLDTELYPDSDNEENMDTARFDCIISAGERDPDRCGRYYDNEMRVMEVVKHNVTEKEAKEWLTSTERLKRTLELEEIGRKKFGRDYLMKYSVNYYYTTTR